MNSRIIFVTQQVGGVGKTFISSHLLHMLERLGHRFTAVDFDSNAKAGILERMLGSSLRVLPPTIESVLHGESSELGKLLQNAKQGNSYLIDCGANYAPHIHRFFASRPGLVDDLKANGVSITIVIPVTKVTKGQLLFPSITNLIPGSTSIQVKIAPEGQDFAAPEYDPALSVSLIWANVPVWDAYQSKAMTAYQLAETLRPDLQFFKSFGSAYAEIFTRSFSHVVNHLAP